MTAEAPALLPCAHCGGPAEMDTQRAYRSMEGRLGSAVAIYCLECSADMTFCREDMRDLSTEDMVFALREQWNRRPAPPPTRGDDAQVERVARAMYERSRPRSERGC